jgi:hypothetical protein
MVTRSKNSITVGWSSVDTGSKILRFQVEMVPVFAKIISAEVPFSSEPAAQLNTNGGDHHANALQPSSGSALSPANRRVGAIGSAANRRDPDSVSVVLSKLYGKRADPNSDAAATRESSKEPSALSHSLPKHPSAASWTSPQDTASAAELELLFEDEENKKVSAVDCTVDKPGMHCTFSFLQQGLTYAFRVRQIAADTGAASAWSRVLKVETIQPPRPVERLQVIGVGPNSFQLAWVDKQGGTAENMSYTVMCKAERSGPGASAQKAVERTVHTTSCEIDGLLNATQYRVTVVPCNTYGESCTSNNATILVRTEAPINWRI